MNLTATKTLDLSNNYLTGPLLEFLAQLQDLKILNLMGNKLTGSVSQALCEKSGDGLRLSLDKNPDLCLSNACKGKKKIWKFVLPLVVFIAVLLLSLIALAVRWTD